MAPLFSISLQHSYFVSRYFDNCNLVPDAATAQLCKRLDLQWVKRGPTYSLIAHTTQPAEQVLTYVSSLLDGGALYFNLVANPHTFYWITELPPNYLGQIGFSSQNMANNARQGETYFLPNFTNQKPLYSDCIGQVAVFPPDILQSYEPGAEFSVIFSARSRPWRYWVVNRSALNLIDPRIKNEQGVEFNRPYKIVLNNGEHGLCFESGDFSIPLQQAPTSPFNLVDRSGSGILVGASHKERCVIKGLPTPNIDQWQRSGVSSNTEADFLINVYL